MDKATEDEVYKLAAYARMNDLPLALKWLMRAMQETKPRPRRKVKATLPSGGSFFMDRARLREQDE